MTTLSASSEERKLLQPDNLKSQTNMASHTYRCKLSFRTAYNPFIFRELSSKNPSSNHLQQTNRGRMSEDENRFITISQKGQSIDARWPF